MGRFVPLQVLGPLDQVLGMRPSDSFPLHPLSGGVVSFVVSWILERDTSAMISGTCEIHS